MQLSCPIAIHHLPGLEIEMLQRYGTDNSKEKTPTKRNEYTLANIIVLKAQSTSDIVCNGDQ